MVFQAHPEPPLFYRLPVKRKRTCPDLKKVTNEFKKCPYCRYGCIRTVI
jgi:hypothetical protein